MPDLRDMLADLGLDDVRTVLQSGNALFQSSKSPETLEALLEKTAAQRFGIAIEFFVRTAREWDAAIAANPFVAEARDDPSHLVLMALKKAPKATELERLTADIKGRERAAAHGRHAYLVYPDGIGRSKMTNAFIESRLATRGSGRNWNTVLKLAGIVRGG